MDLAKFISLINENVSYYQTLNESTAELIIDYIKTLLNEPHNKSIKLTYEHLSCLDNHNYFRIIFSSAKHKADFNNPLTRKCNGLILLIYQDENIVKCKVLAIPPNEFNPKYDLSTVIKNITNRLYHVYEIQDGTSINLYYNEKWTFSTKNAFDISPMLWRGYNYYNIIDDVLSNYTDFNLDNLDKGKTYTIGFKHPAFHPFNQEKEWDDKDTSTIWNKSAWFVQSVCNLTHVISYDENIGLPTQKIIERKNIKPCFEKLKTSLSCYLHSPIQTNVFFGIILKTNNENETNALSDILLESDLWLEIRKLVYQLPYIQNKVLRDKQEYNFKNIQYVILNNFIDFKKRNTFVTLFPQYKPKCNLYNNIIDQSVNKIYNELYENVKSNRFKGFSVNDNSQNIDYENNDEFKINILSNRFVEIVRNVYQVSHDKSKQNADKKNIKNLMLNIKHIDIYNDLLA